MNDNVIIYDNVTEWTNADLGGFLFIFGPWIICPMVYFFAMEVMMLLEKHANMDFSNGRAMWTLSGLGVVLSVVMIFIATNLAPSLQTHLSPSTPPPIFNWIYFAWWLGISQGCVVGGKIWWES